MNELNDAYEAYDKDYQHHKNEFYFQDIIRIFL